MPSWKTGHPSNGLDCLIVFSLVGLETWPLKLPCRFALPEHYIERLVKADIWNRPLTEAEITELSQNSIANAGSSGPRIVGMFSADWTGDEEPEGTYMSGVAAVGDEFLHITDAANGSNGSFMIEDFSGGAVFTDFELSFRFHMSDSTCCGSGDDTTAAHLLADGLSINIANDLPDLVTPAAEEGAGTGIRINFDTWDSGGGEAPAIDFWSGATHTPPTARLRLL